MRIWACALIVLSACGDEPARASAFRIASRAQLVGGPRALGDLGDVRISNQRVRFIVQDISAARAFGPYGGSVIDADLARPDEQDDPRTGLNGQDGLGELFPSFFLSAAKPSKIEIVDDGSTGRPARVRVYGTPSEFMSSTKYFDDAILGTGLEYRIDYSLGPKDDFLTVSAAVLNVTAQEHRFPTSLVPVPIGFIALFGEGQPLFIHGDAGYDARYSLEKAYKRNYKVPALPGLMPRVVAVDGPRVSYGLTFCTTCKSALKDALPGVSGYVWNHRDEFGKYGAQLFPESMHVPFVSGSLFGLFVGEIPDSLPAGAAMSTSIKLRVGPPSVATQVDALYGEQGDDTGKLAGLVREERSLAPVADATVVVFAGDGTSGAAVTSARSDHAGRFHALVPPGRHTLVVRKAPHPNGAPLQIDMKLGGSLYVEPVLPRAALLAVEVTDETGRRIPAKITVDAPYDAAKADADPKSFLYDLRLGDPYRVTDLIPDTADPETRRYVETTARLGEGRGILEVRPGKYRITASRGPAYSIATREVTLAADAPLTISLPLRRLIPARGRVAADLHVHAIGSVDSDVTLEERAKGFAAEGVDYIALTEHNALLDMKPAIQRLGLTDFIQSTTGTEVSALEAGHWNAYPMKYLPAPAAHGAVLWAQRAPQQIFDDLRAGGPDGGVVVQANHPRDNTLGYFFAYGMTGEALTGEAAHDWPGQKGPLAPSGVEFGPARFSLDFDAMEVLTGKRFDRLRTFRVPNPPPPEPHPPPCTPDAGPGCMGAPGSIVRDTSGSIAFPGTLEDWEHLLDFGVRVTAVGNSDTHGLVDEPGYPRNLIDIGRDWATASDVAETEIAAAILAGRVVVTNGPEIRLTVLDPRNKGPDGKPREAEVGDLLRPDASGYLEVRVVVDAAPWVDVQRVAVLAGTGGPCDEALGDCREWPVPFDPSAVPKNSVRRLDKTIRVPLPAGKDSWIAARAEGDKPMWPVVLPLEVPPLLVADAIAGIASAVGYTEPYGNLKPVQKTLVRPFALTNPVLVDGNFDGKFGRTFSRRGATAAVDRSPRGSSVGRGTTGALLDLRAALREWRR